MDRPVRWLEILFVKSAGDFQTNDIVYHPFPHPDERENERQNEKKKTQTPLLRRLVLSHTASLALLSFAVLVTFN